MNVVQFPIETKLSDIPGQARNLAEGLEAGRFEGAMTALVILDCGDRLEVLNWGDPISYHECIGIYEVAKAQLLRNLMEGTDDE